MSSARKKVIVRKFSRDWLAGYVAPANFSADFAFDSRIEILDLFGKVVTLPLDEVKWLCFVRDFNSGETDNPERLLRKSFAGRPRNEGLWLRLCLRDEERIEGIASNDISLLDPIGIFIIPPDIRSNTQRIYIPRMSIAELEIVATISPALRRKKPPSTEPATARQEDLFSNLD
jgi:hypothetical protein